MRQLPAQDVAEDFRISVGVCWEAAAAVDAVFVQHTQRSEVLVSWIVVVGKREGVICIEPAVVCVTAVCGPAGYDLRVRESFGHCVFDGAD